MQLVALHAMPHRLATTRTPPSSSRSQLSRSRRCPGAERRVMVTAKRGAAQEYVTHTEAAPQPPPGAGIDQGAIKDVALFWVIGGVAYWMKTQETDKKKTAAAVVASLEAEPKPDDGADQKADEPKDEPKSDEPKKAE